MNISLNGYGTGYVTLEAAEGLTEGVLAKISANHTAAAAGDGEAFIGPAALITASASPEGPPNTQSTAPTMTRLAARITKPCSASVSSTPARPLVHT